MVFERLFGSWAKLRRLAVRHKVKTAVTLLCTAYLIHYYVRLARKPRLFFKREGNAALQSALARCPTLQQRYYPYVLGTNAHVQLALMQLCTSGSIHRRSEREELTMEDGGTVSLDWFLPPQEATPEGRQRQKVLIALHGLTGGAEDSLVGDLVEHATSQGWTCVAFNRRGHSSCKLSTPHFTVFGDTTDFREVIAHVAAKVGAGAAGGEGGEGGEGGAVLCAVGISAGSGLLAKYLGEVGHDTHLTAAVAVSPGYDLDEMVRGRVPLLYNKLLTMNLKKFLLQHRRELEGRIDIEHALAAESWTQFDERVLCRLYGMTVDELYRRFNPMEGIENVRVPTLCLNSMDDPVCVKELIPFERFSQQDHMVLAATECGSHCTFYEGIQLKSWAARAAVEFIDAFVMND